VFLTRTRHAFCAVLGRGQAAFCPEGKLEAQVVDKGTGKTKVSFALFRFALFRFALFRFALFRFALFRFALFRFALFRFALFRFALFCFAKEGRFAAHDDAVRESVCDVRLVRTGTGEQQLLKNGCLEYIEMIVLPQLGKCVVAACLGKCVVDACLGKLFVFGVV